MILITCFRWSCYDLNFIHGTYKTYKFTLANIFIYVPMTMKSLNHQNHNQYLNEPFSLHSFSLNKPPISPCLTTKYKRK